MTRSAGERPRRVDAHVHLLPDAYRAELERSVELGYPLPPWSPELTLEFMDRYGIDAAVMWSNMASGGLSSSSRAWKKIFFHTLEIC